MKTSIDSKEPDHYIFIIDTNKYAGEFEREMCAYVTGKLGACGVGEEYAKIANEEIPEIVHDLDDLINLVPDLNGHKRPVSIFPNPKYGTDSNENHAVLTEENKKEYPNHAYFSVGIYFEELPEQDVIEIMKNRAKYIGEKGVGVKGYEEKVEIEGFRFLGQYTLYKEI